MKIEIYQMERKVIELKDNSFFRLGCSYLGVYEKKCVSLLFMEEYCAARVSSYQDSNKINSESLAVEITEQEFNSVLAKAVLQIAGIEIVNEVNPILCRSQL